MNRNDKISKPSKQLIRLSEIGSITGISVVYKQTGTETAESFVTITGSNGMISDARWNSYRKYLELGVFTNTVARVKRSYIDDLAKWKSFEEENQKELAEYERLKAKFG